MHKIKHHQFSQKFLIETNLKSTDFCIFMQKRPFWMCFYFITCLFLNGYVCKTILLIDPLQFITKKTFILTHVKQGMPWKMTVIYLQDFGLHFAILVWKIQGLKQLSYFHSFNTFLHIHRIKVPFFMWICLLFQMRNNVRKDNVRSLQMGSYQIYSDSFIFQRNYV